MNLDLLFLILTMLSLALFIKFYGHMLLTLIGLEYLVSLVLLNLYVYFCYFFLEFYLIYFLLIVVCESILGMILLVELIRYFGIDSCKVISLMEW